MAAPTLYNIRSKLGAGARSNLFSVSISSFALGKAGQVDFSFLTKAAALPSSTIGLIEIPFRGRRLKVAGDRTFTEWTTTVISNEAFTLRRSLEDYQKRFNVTDFAAAETFQGDRDASRATVVVKQLAATGSPVRTYYLQNAFPSEIGAIDLSYDSTDAIEEFTVTWTYDYFTAY